MTRLFSFERFWEILRTLSITDIVKNGIYLHFNFIVIWIRNRDILVCNEQ